MPCPPYFNTTLVDVKPSKSTGHETIALYFNTTLVDVKRSKESIHFSACWNFNTTLVDVKRHMLILKTALEQISIQLLLMLN